MGTGLFLVFLLIPVVVCAGTGGAINNLLVYGLPIHFLIFILCIFYLYGFIKKKLKRGQNPSDQAPEAQREE